MMMNGKKSRSVFRAVFTATSLCLVSVANPAFAGGYSGVHGIAKVHTGPNNTVHIYAHTNDLFGNSPDNCDGTSTATYAVFKPHISETDHEAAADRVLSVAMTIMVTGLKFDTWFPACSGNVPYFEGLTMRQ